MIQENVIVIKIIRAFILFISLYIILKYFTIGKIPYNEIFMISSTAIIVQILLDIYRPIIIIENKTKHNHEF